MSIIYDNLVIVGGGTQSPLLIYTQSKGPVIASFSSDGVLNLAKSFRIPNGSPGYILMSDPTGLATWTASSFVTGQTGSNGSSGTSGSSGVSGLSGSSGTSGSSGVSGLSGSSGTSGSSGVSGLSGSSGTSGVTGATGPGFNTIYTPGDNRILTSDGTNNSAVAESLLTWDGNKLTINGTTGSILEVNGSVGQLFTVNNSLTGVLYQVSDISGIPIMQVNSNGAIYINSANQSNLTQTESPFSLISINKLSGSAGYFDYRIKNINGYARAGTIICIWDPISNTTELTDICTPDLGGSTTPVSFSSIISGDNLILNMNISSSNWSIKIGARVI